jgi:putative sigma-54 modulation protein
LGFSAKQELTNFINEKVGKLSQFYDKIISSEVCLCAEKLDTKENKLCDIRLIIPGKDLFVCARCKTFEEAIVQSVDGLVKQMEKKKA